MFEGMDGGPSFIKALINAMAGPPAGPMSRVPDTEASLKTGDACAPASKEQYSQLVDLANELGVVAPATYMERDMSTYPHLHVWHGYVIGGKIPSALKVNWMPVAEFDARMRETGRILKKSGKAEEPIPASKKKWEIGESTSWSTPPRPIHGSPAHQAESAEPKLESRGKASPKVSEFEFKITDGDAKSGPDRLLEAILGISPNEMRERVAERFKPVEGWTISPDGLPALSTGDRVERGRDWLRDWRNQDGGAGKQGTVIGPAPDGDPEWLAVRWDNGNINTYPYTSELRGVVKSATQPKKPTTQTQTQTPMPPPKKSPHETTRALIAAAQEKARTAIAPHSVAIDSSDTSRIIIPTGMSKSDAADELYRQHEEDMKVANYSRMFDGYYYEDVLIATRRGHQGNLRVGQRPNDPGRFFPPEQPPKVNDGGDALPGHDGQPAGGNQSQRPSGAKVGRQW